eukprot:GHVU01190035.1.p2 GENE.GHVU01190035.1~~GHVU01190035.1.p2  ORF type:complete len:104 (-),score=3.61 GHVU01190035.1:203-514(-)
MTIESIDDSKGGWGVTAIHPPIHDPRDTEGIHLGRAGSKGKSRRARRGRVSDPVRSFVYTGVSLSLYVCMQQQHVRMHHVRIYIYRPGWVFLQTTPATSIPTR